MPDKYLNTNLPQLMKLKHSFPPYANPDTKVLILGSMPGERSLELNQYYGHPMNRFWRVIAHICGVELPSHYEDRLIMLSQNQIALWDVAAKALREGSLDSAIKDVEPNDIIALIDTLPSLTCIVFNGRKAEQLFIKYFRKNESLTYLSLPSTSPANAGCSIDSLIKQWSAIKCF